MAVQDYELLLRVRADLLEAISGLKGLTTELGGAKVAADATGESADAASARIKAMVQASLAQQQAMEGATAATQRVATESKRIVQSADEQAAAFKRTQLAAQVYRDAEAARSGAASATAARTAELAAQRAEMGKLAGQIDPTISALAKLDAQERSLNAMRKAGVVGLDDYTKFKAVIDNNRLSVKAAGESMHTFSLNSSMARRELGRLGSDLVNGNWGRFQQTSLTLANYSGLMSAAFSPLGLAIGAVVGSLGAFAIAAAKGAEEEADLNRSLIATGNYAGITATQLHEMAARVSGPIGQANATLQALAASGHVVGDRLQEAGQAATDMAAVTGMSIEKAVQAIISLQDDPVAAVKKLDDQYHFLTLTQYENIKALQAHGDADDAAAIAQTALAQAFAARAADVGDHVGWLEQLWGRLRDTASAAWAAMKNAGREGSNTSDLDEANTKLQAIKDRLPQTKGLTDQQLLTAANSPSDPNHAFFAGDLGTIQQLVAQKNAVQAGADMEKWEAQTEAENTKIEAQAKKASDVMSKYLESAKANEAKAAEIATVKAATSALIRDNPAGAAGYQADQATALAAIEKKYAAPNTGRARSGPSDAAAGAAQKDLIKLLGDEQGALDPVAKIWAKYNDEVSKANDLAAKAKTAKGANVVAIDALRDALVKLYGTARDNDLAKLTDKDREAWEKLRDSLRTPAEAKLDKALAQIRELDALLEKGKISASEYSDAIKRIGEKSVGDAPKYQGIDGAVGGPMGELDKNAAARTALEKWHAEALKENERFRQADTKSEEAYQAGKAKIDAQYAAQSQGIERSRQQLTLTAAADFFGNLAQLSHSHNRKMAEIGKAAAIAQAIIQTYTSATEAYAAMAFIPYIGPFLGAAAAAAAIVAGLANVNQIRSQSVGFSGGGYTGPGSVNQPAGVVHAGEVVWSQKDIARAGGVSVVEAMRLGRTGYADGGYVERPWTSTAGLAPDRDESASLDAVTNRPSSSAAPQVHNHNFRFLTAIDADDLAQKILNTPSGEKLVVNHVIANGSAVKQRLG